VTIFDVDGQDKAGLANGPAGTVTYTRECAGAPAALNGGTAPQMYLPQNTLLVTTTGLAKTLNEHVGAATTAELSAIASTTFACAPATGGQGDDPTDSFSLSTDSKQRSVGFFIEDTQSSITLVLGMKTIMNAGNGGRNFLFAG